jgi:hypothetical protein
MFFTLIGIFTESFSFFTAIFVLVNASVIARFLSFNTAWSSGLDASVCVWAAL